MYHGGPGQAVCGKAGRWFLFGKAGMGFRGGDDLGSRTDCRDPGSSTGRQPPASPHSGTQAGEADGAPATTEPGRRQPWQRRGSTAAPPSGPGSGRRRRSEGPTSRRPGRAEAPGRLSTPRPTRRRRERPEPCRRTRGASPRTLGGEGHPKPGGARRDNGSAPLQQRMGRAKGLQRAPGSPRGGPATRHHERDPTGGRRQIGTRPQTIKHPGKATRGCWGRGAAGQGSAGARRWPR